MKGSMFSQQKLDYLFDHLFGGFESSNKGIHHLRETGLVGHDEYTELLEKNAQRLIDRIKEFKIQQKIVSLFFAGLFFWIQISNNDMDMRRGRRVRSGRRRHETEDVKVKIG